MPNSPYLDKSVQWRIRTGNVDFHEPGYQDTVRAILDAGLATEVERLISGGKEADVYLARYRGAPLAVKAFRLYRTSHRGGRAIKVDTMAWIAAREFEMLHRAWKGGARVPTPARRVENLLAMRYLGDEEGPAPRLKDVRVERPQEFLDGILADIEKLAKVGLVHGDMSPYNVLVHKGDPWFIDFPDCLRVDRLGGGSTRSRCTSGTITSPWTWSRSSSGSCRASTAAGCSNDLRDSREALGRVGGESLVPEDRVPFLVDLVRVDERFQDLFVRDAHRPGRGRRPHRRPRGPERPPVPVVEGRHHDRSDADLLPVERGLLRDAVERVGELVLASRGRP